MIDTTDAVNRDALQQELLQRVLERTDGPCQNAGVYETALRSLVLLRMDTTTVPSHTLYTPAMCVNLQGSKLLLLDDETIHYEQMQYLMIGVDVPLVGERRSPPGRPFVGLALDLDLDILRDLVEQIGVPNDSGGKPHRGFIVGDMDVRLTESLLRVVKLLDTPEAIPVLYPHVVRELYYWLLRRSNGAAIARLALRTGNARPIVDAIQAIRSDLARQVRVDELAADVGMSPSSFHAHFRAVTSLSPVQYQKRLRLMEARRLMRSKLANASEAAFAVGYSSLSQFSREYARMFGTPPSKDAAPQPAESFATVR